MDQLLLHSVGRLRVDNSLRPHPRGTDGCSMKPNEAPATRRRRRPSLGEGWHCENLARQPVEIRAELLRRQRNGAPAAWTFAPHVQAVTGAAGQNLPLVEAHSTPDRRRPIADGEQRKQRVRWDLEETNAGRTFVDGPK